MLSRAICFTDIPFSECQQHCEYFSHFGISFPKHYLIKYGASPVLYCVNPRIIMSINKIYDFFQAIHSEHMEDFITNYKGDVNKSSLFNSYLSAQQALRFISGLLKNYSLKEIEDCHIGREEESLIEKIDENFIYEDEFPYYYEREWRMIFDPPRTTWCTDFESNVYFPILPSEIRSLIVPRKYFQDLCGQIKSIFPESQISIFLYEDLAHM